MGVLYVTVEHRHLGR